MIWTTPEHRQLYGKLPMASEPPGEALVFAAVIIDLSLGISPHKETNPIFNG